MIPGLKLLLLHASSFQCICLQERFSAGFLRTNERTNQIIQGLFLPLRLKADNELTLDYLNYVSDTMDSAN